MIFENLSKKSNFLTFFDELQRNALNSINEQFSQLFEKHKDFIKTLNLERETLILKILYYKPEFDMENLRKKFDFDYFNNEAFRKSINGRLGLYCELYGIKKGKSLKKIGYGGAGCALLPDRENILEDVTYI